MFTAMNPNIDLDLNIERRCSTRTMINAEIQYKLSEHATCSTGQLIDLSQTGALITLSEPLSLNTQLSIIIDNEDGPIEIIVEVARVAEEIEDAQHAFGCVITEIKNM